MRSFLDAIPPPILLAQCKAYQSLDQICQAIDNLLKTQPEGGFSIYISLPFSYMAPISEKYLPHRIHPGVEGLLDTDEGSFTGSIAGKILHEGQAQFAMIGTVQDRTSHSSTSNHLINKVKTALNHQIPPFICIGETLQEHQEKKSKIILSSQLKECIEGLCEDELKKLHIVYNAEWISRTPWEAASPELHEAYGIFKEVINETLGSDILSPQQLIVAIPAYSNEVHLLIKSLQTASHPLINFSIGILGLNSEYLQPLIEKEIEPEIEKTVEPEIVKENEPVIVKENEPEIVKEGETGLGSVK